MSSRWIFDGAILVVAAGVVLALTVIGRSLRAQVMVKKIGDVLSRCAPYPAGD